MISGIIGEFPKTLEGCSLRKDGLYHCDTCGEAREYIIPNGFLVGRKVRCICKCLVNERDMRERDAQMDENNRRRRRCFGSGWEKMSTWTFGNDDQRNISVTNACKGYVDDFDTHYKEGAGILMYGDVGSGKSFMAACIANAVLDMGKSVLMSNFSELINRLQSGYEDRQAFVDSLNTYALIVIDDLGIERNTEYMQEQVYNIVNTRHRAGRPIIITTNLSLKEIMSTGEIGKSRIYDRLLEKCFPLEVNSSSRRIEKFAENCQQKLF